MARREKKKQEVSLFPFLDILACVIGNLILIITAVVLEQVDTKPVAEAVERESQLAKVAAQEQQIAALEKQLTSLHASNRASHSRLERIEQQIELAEDELEQARNQLSRVPRNLPQVDPAMMKNKAALESKKKELAAAVSKIQAEIASRKKVPERSISLMPALVTPFQAHSLIPTSGMFVEVHKDGITVFPAKQFWNGKQEHPVKRDQIAADPVLGTVIQAAFQDPNKIVVLLVRPDGLDTYQVTKRRFDTFQDGHREQLEQKIFNNPKSPLFSAELTPLRQRKLYSKIPLPGKGVLPADEMAL
jgi:hypothetical protein